MRSSTLIHFYGVHSDLLELLTIVEGLVPVSYLRAGNFLSSSPLPVVVRSARELPELGIADSPSGVACRSFLVFRANTEITFRTIDAVDGPRVCIDQLLNPDTVGFSPAGMLPNTDPPVILEGCVGTASSSPTSRLLMKTFSTAFRKASFRKRPEGFVGPDAFAQLVVGARLTPAVQSPSEYDVAIDSS